ncbi:hypothetical protein BBK36DRAFT_1161585 [Trichoderma citrinoviride]|uniref:ERCC4 domain-containing protein n=1 Tax=Trichoderma citrinoviride TaxID=58853 RepID=A0A2T4B2S3_9HYPO|nr:hypothetical protein BBK36DRAFT_1161585 [Trichoderma citrinoviride]PTB63627.1 hypothetical protein BBK36DRAFT_1161585 [Trichoderma citrinoviride]
MASQVIDLISSSPSLPAREASPLASSPIAIGSPQRNKHGRSRSRSPNLFVTSDLGITDDEAARHDARLAKRPRVSVSESPPVNLPRPPQPPFLSAISNRPNRAEFDPIEFTSSIDPDTPKIQHHAIKSSTAPNLDQTHQAPPHIGLSSDPFASSPPPPPAAAAGSKLISSQNTTANIIIDDISDPFASSPLPPHQPQAPLPDGHLMPSVAGSPDLFASSQDDNLHRPANASTSRRAVSVEVVDQSWRRRHWDPISSSAPEQTPRVSPPKRPVAESRDAGPIVISIDSDSAGTSDDEFPDIADFGVSSFRPRPRSPIRRSRSDIISSRSSRPKAATGAATAKTAEQRARDKEAQAAAKAAEKERKRREKEQLKEAKALEKERATALAEVNKVRTDKKVSTPEMILNMPSGITEGLKAQLETLLDGLSVEHTTWNSPVTNAFKWQRKVRSRFDEEMGHWEPVPLRIMPEKHVLILMTADEFVGMAVEDTVDSSVSQAKRHFPGHELIYILEGMNLWLRKNRNIRNRRFTSGVRAQDQPPPEATAASSSSTTTTTTAPRRRRKNAAAEEYIAEDIVEDAMLHLQIEHDVLIHHTNVPLESAQWIVAFTQHISTIPYKKMRDKMTSAAGFCMESGQVRTGDDARDTYVRMLQEIARVTAPIAYGIVSEFDSVSKLVTGLEQGGPLTLESVRKSVNKDGVASERTVGQAVSRRIHKVFTGRDETSTDV